MMQRYYEVENRRIAHKLQKEHGNVFTFEQISDVCDLVNSGKGPDGTYGDDECVLYELLIRKFNV